MHYLSYLTDFLSINKNKIEKPLISKLISIVAYHNNFKISLHLLSKTTAIAY